MRAAVYAGPGTSLWSVYWKSAYLQKYGWHVTKVGPVDICHHGFLDQFDLLVLPGGEARFFHQALGEEGFSQIYAFWQNHVVWGACAGAFYLSRHSYWREGLPGEILHSRKTYIFGGKTEGPYHKAQMSPSGTKVQLCWDDGTLSFARCFQGPVFSNLTNHDVVFATYANRGGACGGLTCYATDGPGKAILTGFHPEMDWTTGLGDMVTALWAPAPENWESGVQITRDRFARMLTL